MLNLLNMSVWEYLRENVVLAVVLAIILALIAALSGIMIYLQVKAKKNAAKPNEPEAASTESNDEAADETASETKEVPADKTEEAVNEQAPAIEQAPVAEEVPVEKAPEKKNEEKEEEKPVGFRDGKWIIRKTENGTFTFQLYAANGGIMLESSKEYSSLSNAKKGIETYKKNFEGNNCKIVSTKAGHFVYRLTNVNGMLLAVSSNYTSKASCENALESTKRYALNAPVEVITD